MIKSDLRAAKNCVIHVLRSLKVAESSGIFRRKIQKNPIEKLGDVQIYNTCDLDGSKSAARLATQRLNL